MMDVKISIVVILFLTLTFVTAPVHGQNKISVKTRLAILERKFTTSTMEISALQQMASSMEDRLAALDSDNNTNEVTVTHVTSYVKDDAENDKIIFKAFQAEKIQRLRLQKRCEKLEAMINDLKESHEMERNNMNKRLDEISRFQQRFDLSSLQKQVETNTQNINGYDASLNKTFSALTSKLDNKVEETTKYIDTEVSAIQDSISSKTDTLNQKIDEYKTGSVTTDDIIRLQQGKKISFSARLKSSIADIKPENILVLDDVLTNDGNAYSRATGKFTAPIDGTYVFFVHILATDRALEMRMDKNKQGVMYVYVNGKGHASGSNMVVLKMVKGDTVNVVKSGHYGSPPFYVHHLWTTFSGFLLYEN